MYGIEEAEAYAEVTREADALRERVAALEATDWHAMALIYRDERNRAIARAAALEAEGQRLARIAAAAELLVAGEDEFLAGYRMAQGEAMARPHLNPSMQTRWAILRAALAGGEGE